MERLFFIAYSFFLSRAACWCAAREEEAESTTSSSLAEPSLSERLRPAAGEVRTILIGATTTSPSASPPSMLLALGHVLRLCGVDDSLAVRLAGTAGAAGGAVVVVGEAVVKRGRTEADTAEGEGDGDTGDE